MANKVPYPHRNLGKHLRPAKAPRADFALPGGRFPLNTPGRVQVADKDAAVAQAAGTITAAQEAAVRHAVAEKRGVIVHADSGARMRHNIRGKSLADALS